MSKACYWCKTCSVIEDAWGNLYCFDCDDDQIVEVEA